MRRDLNPQTLRLTAERATYLRHAPIFLNGQNLHPQITYSQGHMLNGAYGDWTRHLLLAKQASPHCDLYPIFAGSIPAGIFNLPAIHLFNPVFKLNGNLIWISGLVRCIWKMSHLNNLSIFLMPSFTLLTFLFKIWFFTLLSYGKSYTSLPHTERIYLGNRAFLANVP
mgnify:CR=1 FL=1